MSDKSKILEEIKNIVEQIEKYNLYYYEKNESLVSDLEYDELYKKLEQLEKENPELILDNSPTKKVGTKSSSNKFKKVEHKTPMLSLDNSYNTADIKLFIDRIEKSVDKEKYNLSYDLELKLDGLSISIIYENGKLKQAVTRGDGVIGEDVTENVLAISSVPKNLKEPISLEVRGEIVLPLSKFNELNEQRLENNEEVFANPRNAAAGTLRQLDVEVVRERGLDAYFYFLINPKNHTYRGKQIQNHREALEFIKSLGIKTTGICDNLKDENEIEKRIEFWNTEREKLDYETDGLVIKVDDIDVWEEMGARAKSPRWAIAYKFPAKQITTKLKAITWQVGRTGKITPVAELEEVFLSGSNVKRASLHNYDEILRKDIRIGDTVFVEKAAEIIPQVVKAVKEVRTGLEKSVPEPTNCPSCHSPLIKEEGSIDFKCPNPTCPGKIQGGIEYFVSRDGMNILGFGEKLIFKFIKEGFIKDFTDIYNLKSHRDVLINLDKLGVKSIDKLLENIEQSKSMDFSKTLYSLGLPSVGKTTAKILAEHSRNIDNLSKMAVEELSKIDGIGEKSALGIFEFFRDENNIKIIEKLKSYGVNFEFQESIKSTEKHSEEFLGKTFLFTGKLQLFTREKAQKLVEERGGINASGVNKKLDFLITGEDAGSKLEKAEKIDTIKILTEEEFLKMVKFEEE